MEREMREAVEILRIRGRTVTSVTHDGVVEGVPDERGKLPANPDTGSGTEPGTFVVTCDGQEFRESFFAAVSPQTSTAFADAVEAALEVDS